MTTRWMSWAAAGLLAMPWLASAPLPGLAQDTGVVGVATPIGVAHIALRVSSLDEEVNFFNKLGYEKAFADAGSNGRMMEIIIKVTDETFIQLYPQSDPKQPLGFMHVAYEAADLRGLNATYVRTGLKAGPVQQDGAGDLWFTMPDPDGRPTEFTEYLANSRQAADKGQHLGEGRVSDEMLGFEMPVQDIAASQRFYEALGFNAQVEGRTVQLGLPGNPDLRIVLHAARGKNDQPQFLFPVDDARKTADELQRAGLQVQMENKLAFVRDRDGNLFVLLETGGHSPRHPIPGKK